MIILLLTALIALAIFYVILNLDISGVWKFLLVFLEMTIVSQFYIRQYGYSSELGLVLLKSQKGIHAIERLAKSEGFFNFMADTGNSMAYGLLSLVMMRDRFSLKSFLLGLFILALLTYLVAPTAFVFLSQVLKLGIGEKSLTGISDGIEYGILIVGAILLLGGLFLFIVLGIIYYGAVIIFAIYQTLFLGVEFTTSPGGHFLLPGVNLPLFEGILALIVVLVVHEGAHATLARIAKVPLLSSGIVLFGIIPVGAFVEPDEKKLAKLDDTRQTRVLMAGATSNLMTSVMAFAAFVIYAIAIANLGIVDMQFSLPLNIGDFSMDFAIAPFKFIYLSLGLIFSLNFIVGAVNLLPLPLFDGFRIVDVNVKNKAVVNAVMYVTLAFFVVNFLPWLFRV